MRCVLFYVRKGVILYPAETGESFIIIDFAYLAVRNIRDSGIAPDHAAMRHHDFLIAHINVAIENRFCTLNDFGHGFPFAGFSRGIFTFAA